MRVWELRKALKELPPEFDFALVNVDLGGSDIGDVTGIAKGSNYDENAVEEPIVWIEWEEG